MNSYPRALAQFVDWLTTDAAASISESPDSQVTISGLEAPEATALLDLLAPTQWPHEIVDASDFPTSATTLSEDLAPYSVTFSKPPCTDGIAFLSTEAFGRWLSALQLPNEGESTIVRVAASTRPFRTQRLSIGPWQEDLVPAPFVASKPVHELVRVLGDTPRVPQDVGALLLCAPEAVPPDDAVFRTWLQIAYPALVLALAGEVENHRLVFPGPPRLTLAIDGTWPMEGLGLTGFADLQAAAAWVYEAKATAETRHRLFMAEFARVVEPSSSVAAAVVQGAALALEGARISYQYGLNDQSKDALKNLSDLRKSVMDETAKIIETGRQLALNTAGALFYGLGLLAGKLLSSISPWVLDAMGVLGALYLGAIIGTNYQFLRQQRSQRLVWRKKLYRYLTNDEYADLVATPVRASERTVEVVLVAALVLGVVMTVCILVNDHSDAFVQWITPRNKASANYP